MNRITFPLKPRMQGPAVAELQAALQLLLDRGVIPAGDERSRRAISEAFLTERTRQFYGGSTQRLVGLFQESRRLQGGGEVDQATAEAINGLLQEWGLLAPRARNVAAGLGTRLIQINPDALTTKGIGEVQSALKRLKIDISKADLARKELGASTTEGIKRFQERAGLPADGRLTAETVSRLNAELAHGFVTGNKTRTERLQHLLQGLGLSIEAEELKSRRFGPSTQKALQQFQAGAGITPDGRISDEAVTRLREEALKKRFGAKNRVAEFHRTLLRTLHIAKLTDVRVDAAELKGRQIGPSTEAAIKAVQAKYRLPATGKLDPQTYERMLSVAASLPQPAAQLKPRTASELRPVTKAQRLNMKGAQVNDLQGLLAFLGYQIDESEFKSQTYGKTTRKAVVAYQKSRSLPVTGNVEGVTLQSLNASLGQVSPEAATSEYAYRLKGSIRNELWERMASTKVQVWEKRLDGQGKLLAERPTAGGFFDIPYAPPKDPVSGQIRLPFHLQVKAFDAGGREIGSKALFNPTPIAWVNFTLGDQPYRGPSQYEQRSAALSKVIAPLQIGQLTETEQNRQISQAAQTVKLAPDEVMRLVLAHLVAARLQHPAVGAAACYAYIAQNLPPSLPSELLDATEEWAEVERLVATAANGLVFMEGDLQAMAFANAVTANLIPIAVGRQQETVIAALGQLRQSYALEKPILAGSGSLKALLDLSKVEESHYTAVADAFLQNRGLGAEFWDDLKQRSQEFGGAAAVSDLETTVNVGQITQNFTPMLTLLKQKIDDPNYTPANSAVDLATLTNQQWVSLINETGQQVPPEIKGDTAAARVEAYAATLSGQSEQLFPGVALAAKVSLSPDSPLSHATTVLSLLKSNPDLDLRTTNLDSFVSQRGIQLEPAVMTEARVMQRVQMIAPNAATGQAMLDQRIHSSAQIVAMGKEQFLERMEARKVDVRAARTAYGVAEHRYAQVLQRIADYRRELHRANPSAIIDHTYEPGELPPALAALPNLETLFGSLDFCDCPHCRSVYGPPAYLADTLRYLESHASEVGGKTVKQVLFERRPDLGTIKLNCTNTETPMPYIDLVCEVLENAVPAPAATPGFDHQTTRTAAELRAFPEHLRADAYKSLKEADYPMDLAFDLWQEDARLFLGHLGVERWALMEAFQANPGSASAAPGDLSVAGEFWGISTHETTIITTQENTEARQTLYWGFSASAPDRKVDDFLRRTRLAYGQLLDLLSVRWLNPPGDPHPLGIERPNATCNTAEQKLYGLTVDRLDRMHRFLRLWRHTGWAMWELDLLIRTTAIGHDRIDAQSLIRLKQLRQIQQRLGLTVEQAVSLYADINTEERINPLQSGRKIAPLYAAIFLNPNVISPVDAAFDSPTGSGLLSQHKPTLLAAFAVTEAELTLLLNRLGSDALTYGNLSRIHRYVSLARGLSLGIKELLTLEALSGTADIFATPAATLRFMEQAGWTARSGLAVDELEYLLTQNPDSPHGLRDEVITLSVEALREALRSNPAGESAGTVVSAVAGAFALPAAQAQLLLAELSLFGTPLADLLNTPNLTQRDGSGAYTTAVTPVNFPAVYSAYRLLHKLSLLLSRLQLAQADLEWLLASADAIGLLDLRDLPVTGAPAAPLFPAWLALVQWRHVRGLYPEPEGSSLRAIFDMAKVATTPVAEIRQAIATLTQWKAADLNDLADGLGLQHGGAVSDYARIDTYLRLAECFQQIRRIGVSAGMLLAWAVRDIDTGEANLRKAQEIRQAAKSKYDQAVWLEKAAPLENALREKKRAALVSYMVEHSLRTASPKITLNGKQYANPAYWQDAGDLLRYYLIDVEMGACQLTSRIKQAISSVQMFVQRCLLGLEQPVIEVSRSEQQETASDNSWYQWKWMKNYRIWEANRKVFLYPENWIEPELRDDKSPFFQELEAEILQKEITDENVEAAFRSYIRKVHEVARLDLVGAYHQVDDTDPSTNLPPDINLFHVVGRTRSHPATYYYRRFDLNYGEWSAWEKIDLDIQSDQVTPVVYNRQLYLFWLNIVEKPQKVKKLPPTQPSDNTTVRETPNQLEIQLAWSAHKGGGWSSKRVSAQTLIHPWQRPLFAYNLKPRYKKRENLLWLDLYISQSPEFNSRAFWDPYRDTQEYLTNSRPYDETARPWHSSSFLFDGDVVDVKLKGLLGQYHMGSGPFSALLFPASSYDYVHENFGEKGRAINPLNGVYEIAPRLPLPDGMHYQNTRLVNNTRTPNPNRANVLEEGATRTLLTGASSPFEIVFSQHRIAFDIEEWEEEPFFFQDRSRAFFIRPEWAKWMGLKVYNYRFFPFYHPYTALFLRELNRSGMDGLLNRRIQVWPQNYYPGNSFDFSSYNPAPATRADKTVEHEIVDFERYGAYSLYNWEIFFHAPLMIACKLSANQRFDEALRWFHYIFDPTNTDSPNVPQRYWITRPFYEQNSDAYRQQRIEALLNNIEAHKDELRAWKNHPFKPHLIARYRPVAYQKAVVMKYLDNLIAWGDQLFRRDTIESINEATTLYVLAYELLGRRPVKVPQIEHADKSYNELTAGGGLDPFGNKQVEVLMENFTGSAGLVTGTAEGAEPLPHFDLLYFGIPHNDRLLDYWNTVEDRLFKIRHCMNIQGVVRQLPLFEPPIDPALLVKAAAAGVDLSSVLAEITAAPSPYRFHRLAQKAGELCGEVRALGEKLLAALEKSDAEGISLLRSTHETRMLQAVRAVRKQQIQEANANWASLERSKVTAEQRKEYYEGRPFMNDWEKAALTLSGIAATAQTAIAVGYALAGGLALIPRFTTGVSGFGGSPEVTADPIDGLKFSKASEAAVQTLGAIASAADRIGSMAATVGSYHRREDDWEFQASQATAEVAQIEKQILAAQVRLAIAEKELENQELQIEQAQTVEEYMRTKYTNQQLYDWQIRQVASLYFQSYQLAYDMAKRAEKAFQFELDDQTATFVEFGYWDSLKKGLLAGERLANDLHRMEAAYLDQDTRDLEITKHVSLAQFRPLSLIALKESGACTVTLPEWLFDMDYPGHYRRRIKSVSLTVPCVAGPYTGVHCTLTLLRDGVRRTESLSGGYGDLPLATPAVPVTAIATSHAQNDAGMFELSFSDERFLPFEGAGAVSEWSIEIPPESNQFDLATITDVILHVRYTARASGALKTDAKKHLESVLPAEGTSLLVLNHEFANEWHRFLHPTGAEEQALTFTVGLEHLPFYARTKSAVNLRSVDLIVESRESGNFVVRLDPPGATAASDETMSPSATYGGRHQMGKSSFAPSAPILGQWRIQIRKEGAADFRSLLPAEIQNAYLVLGFRTPTPS